jgi:5-methyltetrahydrofolate--homocysteine methyltransferase
MADVSLKQKIQSDDLLILDGAMGTQLFARLGQATRICNDYLNIASPEIVADVHAVYFEAGSDIVLTNTFGANKFALSKHGHEDKVVEINKAGVNIARKATGENKFVLGDIGPSGELLEPLGNVKAEQLKQAFTIQAQALVEASADGLIVETMTALDEATIAIEAAKTAAGDLTVFASMSFDKVTDGFKTNMGVDVETAIIKMISLGVDVVGFNCGLATLEQYVELAEQFVNTIKSNSSEVKIFAEPNAGKPELIDGKTVYHVSPAEFAVTIEKIHKLGINILGGCCGTSPEHIREVAKKLKK